MSWHAHLQLDYHRNAHAQTVLQHQHHGPLRVFKSLYPEGPAVCHNVIVHPPGGLVQGDCLEVNVQVAQGAHALLSTPGATRFYRSTTGEQACQTVRLHLEADARLEWLPLETIVYDGCQAVNYVEMHLAAGAELMAWDVVNLGLPAAQQPFAHGRLEQQMHWPDVWVERAVIAADDDRLLNSPVGLAGHTTLATWVLACGSPLLRQRREALLACGRAVLDTHTPSGVHVGMTCPNDHMLVVRALAHQVEPVMTLWQALWRAWRQEAWQMDSEPPRIWRV